MERMVRERGPVCPVTTACAQRVSGDRTLRGAKAVLTGLSAKAAGAWRRSVSRRYHVGIASVRLVGGERRDTMGGASGKVG